MTETNLWTPGYAWKAYLNAMKKWGWVVVVLAVAGSGIMGWFASDSSEKLHKKPYIMYSSTLVLSSSTLWSNEYQSFMYRLFYNDEVRKTYPLVNFKRIENRTQKRGLKINLRSKDEAQLAVAINTIQQKYEAIIRKEMQDKLRLHETVVDAMYQKLKKIHKLEVIKKNKPGQNNVLIDYEGYSKLMTRLTSMMSENDAMKRMLNTKGYVGSWVMRSSKKVGKEHKPMSIQYRAISGMLLAFMASLILVFIVEFGLFQSKKMSFHE